VKERSCFLRDFLGRHSGPGRTAFWFDIAIIAGAGPFLIQHFQLTDLSLGWAFSSLLFGCVLGSAAAGRLNRSLRTQETSSPRRGAIRHNFTVDRPGIIIHQFVIARFLGGLAVGAVSLASPMYISEVAPPSLRGRLGAFYQMSIVTGAVASYLINYCCVTSVHIIGAGCLSVERYLPLYFFVLLLRAPETPRFLLITGDRKAVQGSDALRRPEKSRVCNARNHVQLNDPGAVPGGI